CMIACAAWYAFSAAAKFLAANFSSPSRISVRAVSLSAALGSAAAPLVATAMAMAMAMAAAAVTRARSEPIVLLGPSAAGPALAAARGLRAARRARGRRRLGGLRRARLHGGGRRS